MRKFLIVVAINAVMALTGCASLDAAHIEGQKRDAEKYRDYTDVEIEKQVGVQKCFDKATDASSAALCAMYGMATGMASTFGGRPTATTIAPTTGENIRGTARDVAPYAAGASAVRSVTNVQAKDPIVTPTQVVRPEVVRPEVILVP